MPTPAQTERITEDRTALERILSGPVQLLPLLPALAHALDDPSLLEPELRVDPALSLEPEGGWTDEQRARARELALDALERLRDHGPAAGGARHTHPAMEWLTGTELGGSYVPMLHEELGLEGQDLRAPDWTKADLAPDRVMRVVIIGAGMSGILAAHRLDQAGIDVVVLEKNPGVGGTWLENTYPGCRVDVSNHVYCYSFMQKADWPEYHSSQRVLLQYFDDCVDAWGIRELIRFETEVTAVVWDDQQLRWTLELDTGTGEETLQADAVISAVGQLNRPRYPDIEGRDSFEGVAFHSARWNHDVDFEGARVAVIGTGCSAMQLIPHLARSGAEVTIYQRTPNWLVPRPEYQQQLPDELLWLFDHVPHYANWFRLRLFWRSHEGLLPRLEVDPEWAQPIEHSVSESSAELRGLLELYLHAEFDDRPDLLEQVMPDYPVGAKRFVLDDGIWAETLKRDNVTLETTPIERITATGIHTVDGVDHPADVLVYGTGFQASSFLTPMKVVGRDGLDLHQSWGGDARAYLGIVSPGFPNFFYLYGPNTNIVINGSIIYFSECEVHYVTRYLRHLLEHGHRALDVKREVHDRYNEWIDEGNLRMAWGVSSVNSWYKSNGGRVAQNWPFSLIEYWEQTRELDPGDYHVID